MEAERRPPMYRVQPYYRIRKVKLPDCMYLVQPIHSAAYWKAPADGEISLDEVERRQDNLIADLDSLSKRVASLSHKLGVDPDSLASEAALPSCADVSISCPVAQSTSVLLALYRHISRFVPVSYRCFKHSSAINFVCPDNIFKGQCCSEQPKLSITLIWMSAACCPAISMMVSPHNQVPIIGMGNIARYLCRVYCPELYEDLGIEAASVVDSWIDRFYHQSGNAKQKSSTMKNLNAAVGRSTWVAGDVISLADIVSYCEVSKDKDVTLTPNVKRWMKDCAAHQLLAGIH